MAEKVVAAAKVEAMVAVARVGGRAAVGLVAVAMEVVATEEVGGEGAEKVVEEVARV
jgi:hypothetical protein